MNKSGVYTCLVIGGALSTGQNGVGNVKDGALTFNYSITNYPITQFLAVVFQHLNANVVRPFDKGIFQFAVED